MEHTDAHDTDEPEVWLTVDVRIPAEQVAAVRDAITGNDDDILLAAETAMRDRINDLNRNQLELSWGDAASVEMFLDEEVRINERREALYGPVI